MACKGKFDGSGVLDAAEFRSRSHYLARET